MEIHDVKSAFRSLTTTCAFAACVQLFPVATARAAAPDATGACTRVDAEVSVQWDRDRAEKVPGVVVRVRFPASLDVPTDATKRNSAQDRVKLMTDTEGGLFDAVKNAGSADGTDRLSIGLITTGIGPGPFARIHFDCKPGAVQPDASEFSCVADVADEAGNVPATCTVTLAKP